MENKYIIIGVLAILLLGSFGYIVYDKYQDKLNQESLEIFRQGYQTAINEIINEAVQCKEIPLTFQNNNQTQQINLRAIECLQENQG